MAFFPGKESPDLIPENIKQTQTGKRYTKYLASALRKVSGRKRQEGAM